MNNKNIYFSLFSGQLYEASDDEVKTADAFQIPLREYPSKSCKKCYGRFYTAYNITHKHYEVCRKCMKKHLDVDRLIAANGKNNK